MAVDPLSPIAPARLRALLLPVGRIRRSRFLELVRRLQAHPVIRLGDVSPDGRVGRNLFSPLAFPMGMIVYDLSISTPPLSHLQTFPFETFREPLVIIAIADGTEFNPETRRVEPGKTPHVKELDDLKEELDVLRASYPRSLVHHLLVFDLEGIENLKTGPEDVTWVPGPEAARSTTIKTVLCDITSLVLGGLDKFTESMQEWPMIESPKASSWGPRRQEDRPTEKLQHRMTMPAQLPSRPNGVSRHNSDTGSTANGNESPTTFDEITRSIQLASRTSSLKTSSKPSSKEHSRERMSMQGLGPASATDRAKSRLKGRMSVVMGNLFLQAGQWPDALKELVEGTSIARASSDYVWHAKGLELILLCLLMFGWAGMGFQIPQICYPTADKQSSKTTSQPSAAEASSHGQSNPENRFVSLQNLVNLLPDLSNNIVNIYTRAANITDEAIPQLLFSETVIRLARLLSTTHARDGILDDSALRHIVMGERLETVRHHDLPRASASLRKSEIANFVFRALPPTSSFEIPLTDSVPIMVGVSSVLSELGLDRKRAFVSKELLTILVTALVQARKIGAAEIGIHPAAGLSALNNTTFDINALDIGPGNMEESTRTLLALAGRTYGVQRTTDDLPSRTAQLSAGSDHQTHIDDSVDAIVDRAFRYTAINSYGDHSLKVDILRACINFCEALPDFQGVLLFTVDLLHTIRGTLMLSADLNKPPSLPREEQVRLLNNVQRTVSAANRLGAPNMEAEYWDDFLVRGVEVLGSSSSVNPIQRSRSEFGVETAPKDHGMKSPFIYNPFAKPTARPTESLLIANEEAMVRVTLQNPFEFEVEIESLRLEGEGVSFEARTEGVWLAPFSLQERVIPAMATAEGTLSIKSCVAKIKYCRERRFPIFKKPWKPEADPKLKRTGLAAKEPSSDRPLSWSSNASGSGSGPVKKGPEAEILQVKVIKAQPTLVIDSISLSQSALMLLEGETRSFDVFVRNTSEFPVDMIFVTFRDSTTRQLETALNNKDNLPADIYELELQLSTNPAFRWRRDKFNKEGLVIKPGETSKLTVDVFGKPGLHEVSIQIDYAYIGAPPNELPETFYSRQLNIPLAITVNASVDITRCDILPFSGDFAWANKLKKAESQFFDATEKTSASPSGCSSPSGSSPQIKASDFSPILSQSGLNSNECEHCLLILDIRNAWPTPLSISLLVVDSPSKESEIVSARTELESVREVVDELQPGHISRFILLVPRIFIENPQKPIPTINPGNKRQFVVSGTKLTYEAEASGREAFWFREELLKHLRGSWKEDSTGRQGQIELRSIRLNPRMIDMLRVDDVNVSFSVVQGNNDGDEQGNGNNGLVAQTGSHKFTTKTNAFLTLTATVVNRSSKPIHPLLRLQPTLRNQPHTVALDLSKRFACTGMLQRALPILEPGHSAQANLGITALCRGEYEIGASVEEVRLMKTSKHEGTSDGPDAIQDMFHVNAPKQRRVWHSRVPCIISAHD